MRKKFFNLLSLLVVVSMLAVPVAAQTGDQPAQQSLTPAESVTVTELQDSPKSNQISTYIVTLTDVSVALYRGGLPGLSATSPEATGAVKLDANSPAALAYAGYLQVQQAAFLSQAADLLGRSLEVRHQYLYALNGMAVRMTPAEAAQLAKLPGVLRVNLDTVEQLDTDAGPALIGAPSLWDGSATGGLPGTQGEGIIVGVLDSGINMDHPSFADIGEDGYDHDNPLGAGTYLGWCDPANVNYDPAYVCNDKLIGAWDYADVSWIGDPGEEDDGPEDNAGHGSHVSSTIAGNVTTASLDFGGSVVTATISGVAPHANIIMYDVCGATGSCFTSDSVAGINRAIIDGVDVLNESIGIGDDTFTGDKQLAYLSALAAGIAASRSAGNAGPGPATVSSEPVWTISSANATHDRQFANTVDVTGPGSVPVNLTGLAAQVGSGPAILSDIAGDIRFDASNPLGCTAFPANFFSSGIALISRGDCAFADKVNNAAAAGAIAVVVFNNTGVTPILMGGLEATTIPSVMTSKPDGEAVRDWILGNTGATAQINAEVLRLTNPLWQDILNSSSSRGPAPVDVIKPDIAAPGTNILAAVATTDPADPPEFDLYSGTSMASPHTAGSLALLRALYPTWTPTQLRTALMVTSLTDMLKEDAATPADPFDMGAGRVDLTQAALVGLVMDESPANFAAAIPATASALNLPSMQNSACYIECSWTRTVSNPTSSTMSWSASYSGAGAAVVMPSAFTIDPGMTATFTVTLDVIGLEVDTFYFGELTWAEDASLAPDVHMPLAVMPVNSTDPASLTKFADSEVVYGGADTTFSIALTNNTASVQTYTVVDPVPANSTYVPGSATGGLVYDAGTNTLSATVELDGASMAIVPGTAPYGYMSLADLDVDPLPCSTQCDETLINITGLAPYVYNGQLYDGVAMVSNGYAIPGTGTVADIAFLNQDLPDAVLPNNVLAPWWTDLDLDGTSGTDPGSGTWYAATLDDGSNLYNVLEWKDAELYDDPTSIYSFQIWILANTDLTWFTYGRVDGTNTIGTVGAEDLSGLVGDTWYYDGSGTAPVVGSDLQISSTGETAIFTYQVTADLPASDIYNEVTVTSSLGTDQAYAYLNAVTRLQVAHLAPFAMDPGTAVTVTLNGSAALTGFAYGDSTGYIELDPGSYLVEIFPVGSPTAAISGTLNLMQGMDYTAIAIGDGINQPLSLLALEDDNSAPAAGSFKLRLGHLSPFADTLPGTTADVRLQDGTVILDDVVFGDVAAYLELPAGEYDLKITTPDGATTLIDPAPVTFAEGYILSAFASGNGVEQDLAVYALPAGDFGFFLPPTDPARLQVAHLAPFAMDPGTAVTITLNGAPALTDFVYGDSTVYLEVEPGPYTIEVFPAGSLTPAITASAYLEPGLDYTAIAIGDGANQPLNLSVLEDDNSAPAAGNFKLRLGHLAPFADTLAGTTADVRLDDGTVILDDVVFGDVDSYIELPAGEYDLKVTTPDGLTTLINFAPLTFSEGDIVSAFAVGEGVNQPLGGYGLPAGALGFFLPLEEDFFMLYLPMMLQETILGTP